jgi:hypothetical protein
MLDRVFQRRSRRDPIRARAMSLRVGSNRDAVVWAETAPGMNEVTRIFSEIEPGDPSAADKLLPLKYARAWLREALGK